MCGGQIWQHQGGSEAGRNEEGWGEAGGSRTKSSSRPWDGVVEAEPLAGAD